MVGKISTPINISTYNILLSALFVALPLFVYAGNADCTAGDYSCNYPEKKQINTNGAIQTVQCMQGKECSQSYNGSLVNGKCTSANVCTATGHTDTGINKDAKQEGLTDPDAVKKAAQDAAKEEWGNGSGANGLEDLRQTVKGDPALSRALEQGGAPDFVADDGVMSELRAQQGVSSSVGGGSQYSDGIWDQFAGGQAGEDFLANNIKTGNIMDPASARVSPRGQIEYLTSRVQSLEIQSAIREVNAWSSALFSGWGSGGGFGSSGLGSGGDYTTFTPAPSFSQSTFSSGSFGTTNCSSGSCIVSGQGAVVQPVSVATNQANMQSAADVFMEQSRAQIDAKNAGTIANYLGDGGEAVWGEKNFGDMVAEGLANAQQQFEGAWRGLQDGFSNAVTSVQDVFAPSAFDGAFGTDPATAFDTSSGADARVGESVTIEVEGQAIPTFYNDQFVKSINENPRPLPSFGGERFAEYVSSNGAVTRPTGDALSFADAHIQNPAFDVKQSGISVTAVESPFTFEIDRSDTRSALDMPTRSVSPFLSHPNPIVSEDAWKSAGPFNTAPSLSRSPVLGSSVNTAPAGWTADAGGKTPILTSGVGRESVSTGRTSAGVSTGNGSGAMGGRGTAGGGTPAGGMGDLAGMLKSLTDMIKGGGGKGSGGQPQQPPIIAAPNNILATPVPSTQFAPPAPLTPAPQVSVVANPNPTQRDATSIVSWTAVWADAQPATSTRECAVIDATGKTHVDHASTTDSFETPKLSQGAYFVVGCKQSGGKLGSALILVRVEGDTQAPVAPPQAALASYESTNGQSAAGRELAAALAAPQEPAQQNNVACDPNSSSYFDCLSNKILFVDKLY